MKTPPPFLWTDTAPSYSHLTEDRLAEMKDALIRSMTGLARDFHQCLYDAEHAKPDMLQRVQDMYIQAETSEPGSLEWTEFHEPANCLGVLEKDEFNSMMQDVTTNLQKSVKLFLNKNERYTLILPVRLIGAAEEPGAVNDEQCYDKVAMLFHALRVPKAEAARTFAEPCIVRGELPDCTPPCHGETMSRLFEFETEAEMVQFINHLLPVGVSFGERGAKRMLN